jgi:hypothetical protein
MEERDGYTSLLSIRYNRMTTYEDGASTVNIHVYYVYALLQE